MNVIETKLKSNEGYLYRIYKQDKAKILAYLDDYAFYINSLLDLFEIKTDPRFIELASYYTDVLIKHFWDGKENNFYYSSDMHESILTKTKVLYDLALPSGNSVSISNLIRLYHITGKNNYIDMAEKMMKGSISSALDNPFGFGWLLSSTYLYIKKPTEITIFTKDNKSDMIDEMNKMYVPNGIFSIVHEDSISEKLDNYNLFKNKSLIKEKPASDFAIICKEFTCSPPLTNVEKIRDVLSSNSSKERIK